MAINNVGGLGNLGRLGQNNWNTTAAGFGTGRTIGNANNALGMGGNFGLGATRTAAYGYGQGYSYVGNGIFQLSPYSPLVNNPPTGYVVAGTYSNQYYLVPLTTNTALPTILQNNRNVRAIALPAGSPMINTPPAGYTVRTINGSRYLVPTGTTTTNLQTQINQVAMQLQTVLAQIRGRATPQQTATLNTIKQKLTTLQTQAGGNNTQITQLQNLVTWVLTNYAWNRAA
jgi:hypothetical protein